MNEKINILYDHYKETCDELKDTIKRRDRLVMYIGLLFGAFFFHVASSSGIGGYFSQYLNAEFSIVLNVQNTLFSYLLWFLLFILSTRYFQTCIQIERSYQYVHDIEHKINAAAGELITREGLAYLKDYPLFSNFIWFFYSFVFPIFFIVVSVYWGYFVFLRSGFVFSSGVCLNTFICLSFVLVIILYMIEIHLKKRG